MKSQRIQGQVCLSAAGFAQSCVGGFNSLCCSSVACSMRIIMLAQLYNVFEDML